MWATLTDYLFDLIDSYTLAVDYEHRDAEHEHEEMPEPGVGPKPR
jgi:hypothetical protein